MALQKASSVGASYRPLGRLGPPEVGGLSLCDSGKTAFAAAGAEGPLNGLVGDPQGVADIFLGQLCFSKDDVNLGNMK